MKIIKQEKGILYTPVIRYTGKNGYGDDIDIKVIGTIHIGMEEYYRTVQKEIDGCDFGFYEGIEIDREVIESTSNSEEINNKNLQHAKKIVREQDNYIMILEFIGLKHQSNDIEYGKNWQNIDIAFNELLMTSGDKVLEKIGMDEETSNSFKRACEMYPEEFRIALKGFPKYLFKYQIMIDIASIIYFGYATDKKVIKERNQILFDAIEPVLEEQYIKELGLHYGVEHIKGIDKYLKHKGFEKTKVSWIPAIDLNEDCSFLDFLKASKKINRCLKGK